MNNHLKCPKCDGEGDKQLIDYVSQFICSECQFTCPMSQYRYKMENNNDFPLLAIKENGVWIMRNKNKTTIKLSI